MRTRLWCRRLRRCGLGLVSLAAIAVPFGAAPSFAAPVGSSCPALRPDRAYVARVERALLDPRDSWGDALLRLPGGPTYAAARRYLAPLLLVGRPAGTSGLRLTDSGVYYLAFGQPAAPDGGGAVALHVADGGEIVAGIATGPKLQLFVGAEGLERYGSCLARLATPSLLRGYLPVLETSYVDAAGIRYREESFATHIPETSALVSFVRLSVDIPRGARVRVRVVLSATGVSARGARLLRGGATELVFSGGGTTSGSSVVYSLSGGAHDILLAYLDQRAPSRLLDLDAARYERARDALVGYWNRRLAEGATFSVPDPYVNDAERNLLIQNMVLGSNYSVGNAYQTFEFPESLATAQVMGEYGFRELQRAIVATSLQVPSRLYPDWAAGQRLLAAAAYEGLFPDPVFLRSSLPALRRYAEALIGRIGSGRLLPEERYASDVPRRAYSLNGQAVDWQGLRAIAQVWAQGNDAGLAARARGAAEKLGARIRAALDVSERRLPDGSLFVPVRLLDDERPYADLTASRAGGYWNLVIPDALASGLIRPLSAEAAGVVRYLLGHGSRLLGLLRFNYYPVPVGEARVGGLPGYRSSGTDDVYLLSLERFLADNHEADQLVLSLYGQLAAGMTDGTFVSGEGATIAPVPGEGYRSMYLPPNATSNAAFLECLRLLLVHETATVDGRPDGLELAYATPRPWLAAGKRMSVSHAPTSFGPISFAIVRSKDTVRIDVRPPTRVPPRSLTLRLRLPAGGRIAGVELGGRPYGRVDRATGTIDLTGLKGAVELSATVRAR
jgi:hypothetical protein